MRRDSAIEWTHRDCAAGGTSALKGANDLKNLFLRGESGAFLCNFSSLVTIILSIEYTFVCADAS